MINRIPDAEQLELITRLEVELEEQQQARDAYVLMMTADLGVALPLHQSEPPPVIPTRYVAVDKDGYVSTNELARVCGLDLMEIISKEQAEFDRQQKLDTKDMLIACHGELPKGYITHLWQRRRLWDLVDVARGLGVRLGCVNKVLDEGVAVTGGDHPEREYQRLVGVVYEKVMGELKWRRKMKRERAKREQVAAAARNARLMVKVGLMDGEVVR